ncbi:MAG: hypothetical protein ACREHV_07390 [Rhizomicrobium sp.]
MHTISSFLPVAIAAVFAVAGFVHIAGPRPLLGLLADWGFGRGFNLVAGAFAVMAAIFLAVPQLRLWGVVLAGFMLFGLTVVLLDHRKYFYAFPNIILLGALPLALVAH